MNNDGNSALHTLVSTGSACHWPGFSVVSVATHIDTNTFVCFAVACPEEHSARA